MKDFDIAILVLENVLERHSLSPHDTFEIMEAISTIKRLKGKEIYHGK